MSLVLPRPRRLGLVDGASRVRERLASLAIGQELLTLLIAVHFSSTANLAFFAKVADTGALAGAGGLGFGLALFVAITALNWLLLLVVVNRWTAKPVLAVLLVATALAAHFMNRYTVYLDPDMVRTILHTDFKESSELISFGLVPPLLVFGVLPAIVVWHLESPRRTWPRAVMIRAAAIATAVALAAGAIALTYQPLASLMRNHRELRYLITPGNYLVSLASVAKGKTQQGPRVPIGLDAHVVGRLATRPRLLVLVVGETARAQNWGLNGYDRQTTPRLAARRDVVNFPDATACGSATEVSLPCMFSPWGRRAYDERRIKRSQGLLHVLEHAGIHTLWRDNQTGCKGVCDGLAFESYEHANVPGDCDAQGCLDAVLLHDLADAVARQPGDQVVVLHQLGNHGPAYWKRYPPQFERFGPVCRSVDLSRCTREQIVAAYDNAILYTDDLLANAIALLEGMPDRDTGLIYLSDHGESLGEHGIYLHGVPYGIAPATQTRIPMVAWLSPGFARSRGIDMDCLRQRARRPVSQDNLFHSVLGLLQVRTRERVPQLDLFAPCERGAG